MTLRASAKSSSPPGHISRSILFLSAQSLAVLNLLALEFRLHMVHCLSVVRQSSPLLGCPCPLTVGAAVGVGACTATMLFMAFGHFPRVQCWKHDYRFLAVLSFGCSVHGLVPVGCLCPSHPIGYNYTTIDEQKRGEQVSPFAPHDYAAFRLRLTFRSNSLAISTHGSLR
jgi:hypothetical protein